MKKTSNITGGFFAFLLLAFAVFHGGVSYAEMDQFQLKSMRGFEKTSPPPSVKNVPKIKEVEHAPEMPVKEPEVFFEEPVAPEITSEPEAALNAYRVGADDELRITVYGEKELSKIYTVSGNGLISMPLIGGVEVEGLTISEVEDAIMAAFSDGYLINPSVSIEVSKYRPFYILGEVRSPGSYSFVSNMSVLNAVALAGGFTYRAERKHVELLRTKNSEAQVTKDHPIQGSILPGDIILVKENFF